MFPDGDAARAYLEEQRWQGQPVCAHCGAHENITARKGKRAGYFRCRNCGEEFTVRSGTIFERSHVPLHKWLYAIHLIVANVRGVSSMQLSTELSVTQATAWFMLSRLREASGGETGKLRDTVITDVRSGG